MARKPPTRPWKSLAATAVIIIAMYSTMGLTGHTSPKLGLDLKGGTSVTLHPKAANGAPVTKGALNKAVDILRQRINGLGVAEADVVVQNQFIVISVPGKNSRQVVDLVGRTARLTFREVAATRSGGAIPVTSPTPTTGTSASPSASPKPGASIQPSASASSSSSKRAITANLLAAASAAPSPKPSATPGAAPVTPNSDSPPVDVIKKYSTATCAQLAKEATTTVQADEAWVVACDRFDQELLLLKPAKVVGTDVSGANATIATTGSGVISNDWEVVLSFTGKGQSKFTALTRIAIKPTPHEQVAIVLDGVVQSAPVIQDEIAGNATITGNFTQKEANDLANVLKYGALPLDFEKSQAQEVSASLGKDSLRAGLLAGAIGLALVILYCFLYYRAMGIVTVLSLSVSGLMVYASVVLLGQVIGFTLTLAGIAGLIVSVGITADSFVVFYERLKDEVREGRTVRSSVDRGWVRARRTIISADFVSILAAVALYLLSVGSVRGFAFTLGLSTMLDLVVVFIFTKPLVSILVRYPLFASSKYSGLSVVASSGAAARRAAGTPQSKEA